MIIFEGKYLVLLKKIYRHVRVIDGNLKIAHQIIVVREITTA